MTTGYNYIGSEPFEIPNFSTSKNYLLTLYVGRPNDAAASVATINVSWEGISSSATIASFQACGASNAPCSDLTAGRAKYKKHQFTVRGSVLNSMVNYHYLMIIVNYDSGTGPVLIDDITFSPI